MHSGPACVFSLLPFLAFAFEFIFSFLLLSIYECRLESSRGRTGEYKMRGCENCCDVSLCLGDYLFINRVNVKKKEKNVPLCLPERRVSVCSFISFLMFSSYQSFCKICLVRTNSRERVKEKILRIIFELREYRQTRIESRETTCQNFLKIHTSCIGKQCAYETVRRSGGQRTPCLYILIQSNVHNIIIQMCICMLCVESVYHVRVIM